MMNFSAQILQNRNARFKSERLPKSRIISILVMLFVVTCGGYFSVFSKSFAPQKANAAWYNSDYNWQYRQKFQISSSSTLTDYQVDLDEQEVARWKMDEASGNALDLSGNSLTATNSGTTVVEGRYGNARNFNGSSAYLYTATGLPNFHLANGYTISAWIKPSALSGGREIVSQWGDGGASNASWFFGLNGSYLYVGNHNGSLTSIMTDNTTALQTDAWYYVSAVYTGGTSGTNAYLYVNGNLVKSGTLSSIPQYSRNYYVGIGRSPVVGTDNYYAGLMDEVRIYRYGMDASAVSYLYENNISPRLRQIYSNTQESGADLRFTTSDGTTDIPYWIENYSASGQNAKIWLKMPTVASGTTDIYAYYGNSSGSAVSSGANTFEFFDDFESYVSGSSIDGQGGWTIKRTGGSGGVKVQTIDSRKMMELTSTSTMTAVNNSNIGSKTVTASLGYAIETSDYTSDYNEYNGTGYGVTSDSQTNGECAYNGYHMGWYGWAGANSKLRKCVNGTATDMVSISDVGVNSVYYRNSVFWIGNTLTAFRNGVQKIQTTDSSFSTFNTIYINLYTGSTWDHDWVAVRKIAPTAPTVALSGSFESDNIAPNNPSVITAKSAVGGTVLNTATIYNHASPYFEWPAIDAAGGASDTGATIDSGVAGYYSYFGTSCGAGGADPATARGLLAEVGGTGVHYSADTNVSLPTALATSGNYCLRIKTADNANNVQSVWEAFVYQFDNAAPNAPSFIAASPSGYTGTDSFSFSWPAATDGAATPASGLAGYQYKRGDGSGDTWSSIITDTSISSIKKYQNGANVFYVRSVDAVDNISPETQTTYYYSADAPSKPTSLAVQSSTSGANAFSFSWVAPSHDRAITNYGYSVNNWPTLANITWTGSTSATLPSGPYATQLGTNNFYLIAQDEAGNYAFDEANVAQISFDCQTTVPAQPAALTISDTSNRVAEIWSLTLKWSANGSDQNSNFDHYTIERSGDGINFAKLADVTTVSYVDKNSLVSDHLYYYRIRAFDNAGNYSLYSAVASRAPSGRFTTAPTITGQPTATAKATEATVSWQTERISDSTVFYGPSTTSLSISKGSMDQTADHSVLITGLSASSTYYYKVRSLDDQKEYADSSAESDVYSFRTLDLPGVANVQFSNITLTTADVSWETSVPATTELLYGPSISYSLSLADESKSLVTKHTLKIKDLNHSSTYHLKITGEDADGNLVSSDDYIFETQKMPVISSLGYQTEGSGPSPAIAISWRTNVPTTSSIEYYPKDGSEVQEESQSGLVMDHKIILKDLNDDTVYNFVVMGTDQFGNTVKSENNTLKTAYDTRPPKIENIVVDSSNVGLGRQDEAQFTVSCKTDEPASIVVEYGEGIKGEQYTDKTTPADGSTKEHLVIVTGLDPSRPYHIRIMATDKAGNPSYSSDMTLITGEVNTSIFQLILKTLSFLFGWVKL